MRVIRGRAEARHLPSRRHYALFRLAALVRMSVAPREDDPNLIVAIDSGQSAAENYSIAAWTFISMTCYLAELFRHMMPTAVAVLAGLLVTPWALQFPMYALGGIMFLAYRNSGPHLRQRDRGDGVLFSGDTHAHHHLQSAMLFFFMIEASVIAVLQQTWIRWVGGFFLTVVAVNAVCAIALLPFRGVIRRMEERCGV